MVHTQLTIIGPDLEPTTKMVDINHSKFTADFDDVTIKKYSIMSNIL